MEGKQAAASNAAVAVASDVATVASDATTEPPKEKTARPVVLAANIASLVWRNPAFGVVAFLLAAAAVNATDAHPFTAARGEDVQVFEVRHEKLARPHASAAVVLAVGGPVEPQEEDWTDAVIPVGVYEQGVVAAYPSPSPSAVARRRSRGVSEYAVQSGDTLSEIAARYGVSTASLAWANANRRQNFDILHPGEVLRVPPATGVLHAVKRGETLAALAKKFSADPGEVILFNGLPADGTLAAGDEIFFPGGSVPPPPVPVRPRVTGGALAAQAPPAQGYFGPPTVWRQRSRGITSWHRGVDLANNCGTPIFASADGTVTRADYGWNGGFGNVVIIAHANGTQTLYAHLLQIYVSEGQQIGRGNVVAQMGGSRSLQGAQAGISSGCHLHFEVHGARNPF